MCEYCDLRNFTHCLFSPNPYSFEYAVGHDFYKPINDDYDCDLPYLQMLFDNNTKRWYMSICNKGWDERSAEIHYCPFCGRKLEEGE